MRGLVFRKSMYDVLLNFPFLYSLCSVSRDSPNSSYRHQPMSVEQKGEKAKVECWKPSI